MIKKLLKYILILVFLALSTLYLLLTPPYVTQIKFNEQHIHITRDSNAIPHIHAPNRRSFLYAWGYTLAEDRLFQITFRKLFAQGRLSESLGNRTLYSDIMMRDLGFSELSQHIADKIKAQNQTVHLDLSAFAQGINDQEKSRSLLPLEFYVLGLKWQPWSVVTILELYKSIYFSFSHNMVEEYFRSTLLSNYSILQISKLIPNTKENWAFPSKTTVNDQDIPQNLIPDSFLSSGIFQPLQIDKIIELGMPEYFLSVDGSNAWAVSGEHTESGKPILSGDPHLDNALPGHWFQFKTTYVQNNKTIRYSAMGVPGITLGIGKSDYFGFSITVCQTDTQDLYRQKVQGNKYLVDGEWRDLRVRNETILVKQGDKLVKHEHKVRLTHRGPILKYMVNAFGSLELPEPISLAWTGFNYDYQSFASTGIYLMESDNLQDLRQALVNGTSHGLGINMLAVTADNHILYQQSGINPIRRNVTMGSYVKDGTSTEFDWLGFYPAHQRMHVVDPKSGFFASANNRVASELYHDGYLKHQIFTARGDRLSQVLEEEIASGRKITNDFARKLVHDTVDVYCRQILPEIIAISSKAKQILAGFDCNLTSDSYQAAFYEVFMVKLWHLTKPVHTQNFSLLSYHVFHQCTYNSIHDAFKGQAQKIAAIHKAAAEAYNVLFQFFKTKDYTQWKWGLFHRDQATHTLFGSHHLLKHIFNRQAPGYGNYHTLSVGKSKRIEFADYKITHKASMRLIVDFGGPDWWVVNGGVSENVLTKQYDDQLKLFHEQKLLEIKWPEEINQQL